MLVLEELFVKSIEKVARGRGFLEQPQVFICVKLQKLFFLLFGCARCTWRMSDVYMKIMQNVY